MTDRLQIGFRRSFAAPVLLQRRRRAVGSRTSADYAEEVFAYTQQ
jgi:hypothetical protein